MRPPRATAFGIALAMTWLIPLTQAPLPAYASDPAASGCLPRRVGESLDQARMESLLRPFDDPKPLAALQEEGLRRDLRLHGVEDASLPSRALLERVSRQNKARVLEALGSTPVLNERDEAEIAHLAANIETYYVHYTHVLEALPKSPIVSSARLEQVGLKGGLNTEPFNRELMQSDDSVFFLPAFRKKGSSTVEPIRQYGNTALVLDAEYAKNHAWVSYYVMYADQLAEFAPITANKDFLARAKKVRTYFQRQPYNPATLPSDIRAGMIELRQSLHQSDYTVSDYEETTQAALRSALRKIKARYPDQYPNFVAMLNDPSQVNDSVAALVHRFGGMPLIMELKVPVAVPSAELKLFQIQR